MDTAAKGNPGPSWLVATAISVLSLFIGWQQYELNKANASLSQKKYDDERFEKSRSHVKLIHKGNNVEITIEYSDPAGFVRSETFEWPQEKWDAFYKQLRGAPPIPRN